MKNYADFILPISTYVGTAGTFVNIAGTWQSFSAVSLPEGDSKPAWKVLRVLANFLELEGFDYKTVHEVHHEIKKQVDEILKYLSKVDNITAKLSSIHFNYWCGTHTKVTACRHLIETQGKEKEITPNQIVFCGDSPNDEPLFQEFEHSVGVANIQEHLPAMKFHPRYVTTLKGGAGFSELVDSLLGKP